MVMILELLDKLAEESGKFRLNINTSKAKIMPHYQEETQSTNNHTNKEVRVLDNPVCIGMKAEGGSNSEIIRIVLVKSNFNKQQEIFKRHDAKLKITIRILNACGR